MKTFTARSVGQWRDWLQAHHQSASEVWLVFHKRHTGRPTLAYQDALDEALCFGWVDSLIKRIDDSRYARKFTPRRADSRWSAINRKRYEQLKAAGRVAPAGLDRAPTDRAYGPLPEVPSNLPSYIEAALRKHARAWQTFEGLAPSHRRQYVLWIDTAKRDETRKRRLAEAVRLLEAGRLLGLK